MKAKPFALGHPPIKQHNPSRLKSQPVEGSVDGVAANKGNDASSRSPQPAYQVKQSKGVTAPKRETLGPQPYGKATRGKGKK